MECVRLLLDHLAWIEHQFLSGIRHSRKAGSLWGMIRGVGEVRKSIHQSWLAKGLGLGLLCWGFLREFRKRFRRVSGISTRTIHLSTTPSLSETIWLILPIVETLHPVTFGYSLSSEAVVMRQLRRWKRLWRRSLTRLHKRTSMGPQPTYNSYLLPVTFAYSLSSGAVVMRELRRWKKLWRRSLTCSHKRTSMGPSRSCWNDTTGA